MLKYGGLNRCPYCGSIYPDAWAADHGFLCEKLRGRVIKQFDEQFDEFFAELLGEESDGGSDV